MTEISCNPCLSFTAIEFAICEIVREAKIKVREFRLTIHAYNYVTAVELAKQMMEESDLLIEIAVDGAQRDTEAWALDGAGVRVRSIPL